MNPESQSAKSEKKADHEFLIGYVNVRRIIGILGMIMPLLLILFTFLFSDCSVVQESVSDYYHTIIRDVFVGILCTVSFFLIVYKGHEPKDHFITSLAGLFALGVAFFPTEQSEFCQDNLIIDFNYQWKSNIHMICASGFFITLAIMSACIFTLNDSENGMTPRKQSRNTIYRICAAVMIFPLIFLAIYFNSSTLEQTLRGYNPVFWLEWIALLAFGVSWIVKGDTIFQDK